MTGHAVLNAQSVDECIIDQNWDNYTAEEHETWGMLFRRQTEVLKGKACDEYFAGLKTLGINESGIPDFRRMNENLKRATGWEVVAVPGLIPSRPFFDMLKNKQFPAGNFIRKREELDYLEEPDIFHDVFGHVPLLTNPAYAQYMQAYGAAGEDAMANKGVKFLARLNWYTIEFGLVRDKNGEIKIYGAGIVSSFGESKYAAGDPSANFLQFDLERVLRTGYYIDDFQATYFVVDSFEKLFEECIERPFVPLYHEYREKPQLSPFETLPGDKVLRKGSGAYWKDFPQVKIKLK
jgi:phenylalanine-4-hydroxylase